MITRPEMNTRSNTTSSPVLSSENWKDPMRPATHKRTRISGGRIPFGTMLPAVCSFALLSGVGFSQERIYAQLTGVAGESTRAGREDWIEVIGLGTKVSSEADVDSGRTSWIVSPFTAPGSKLGPVGSSFCAPIVNVPPGTATSSGRSGLPH